MPSQFRASPLQRANTLGRKSLHSHTNRNLCNFKASRAAVLVGCSTSSQPSYFEVLGVSESAPQEDIKAAFRAKTKVLHPDVNKSPNASRDFMLLRRAYATLSTAELRAEYEAKLKMPSARARDPRFARFERWRREVLPDLRYQLDFWSRSLDGYLDAWRSSLEQRERNLARLHGACIHALEELQELLGPQSKSAAAEYDYQNSPSLSPAPSSPQQRQKHAGGASKAFELDSVSSPSSPAAYDFPDDDLHGSCTNNSGGGTGWRMHELLEGLEATLQEFAVEVAGITSDAGDGTARVDREVEKRYQQLSSRYPAYPDIVWMDVWEETAEQWLAQSAAEAQRCSEARGKWSERLQRLQGRLQALAPAVRGLGQVAGAGTGHFNSM